MRKIYTLTVFLILCNVNLLFAQSYYYYKNQKTYITKDKTGFDIYTNNSFQAGNVSGSNLKSFNLSVASPTEKWANVEFVDIPTDVEYFSKINEFKSNENLTSVQPHFISQEGDTLKLSNYAFVKLKNNNDLSILQNHANLKNFSIVGPNQFMPLWYKLKCDKNTLGNSLEIANYLFETEHFAASNPIFSSKETVENELQALIPNNPPNTPATTCANDTNFGDLWGLENSTNPNADIDICNAWTITEGANVKVAVLDGGIDFNNLDLITNILPISYNTVTGNSPSQIYSPHGSFVAGIIGAIKNNNYQVVGVAPQSKLISISTNGVGTLTSLEQRADGINWAWQNGADIINNSWISNFQSDFLDDAISNALTNGRNGLGTIVIFISGNSTKPQNTATLYVRYPANSNQKILSVGAIDINGNRANFSCYGNELDVVAPGVNIMSTSSNNTLKYDSGTSFAAPHVAGICALILSVNPCLNVKQVNDIIEKTSKKIGIYNYANTNERANGAWNNEMGYGLVNAFEAVKLAQEMNSPTLDLYIKDSAGDLGIEPNTTSTNMWTSDNIWIRQNNDDQLEHENPEYNNAGQPNYVKVRIINKSCIASTGNQQLKLYWAKSSTGLSYPNPWTGGVFHPTTGNLMGNPINTLNIPILQPGEEKIVTLPWIVPNPVDYGIEGSKWNFSILARIESLDDPMTFIETADLNSNVKNNNNIAWKNISIVDLIPNQSTSIVAIVNPFKTQKKYYLEMLVDDAEIGNPIYGEAEVSIKMDDALYNAWERGGKEAQLLSSTLEEKKKIVAGNNVILDNIYFNPNEMGTLKLNFNFLTSQSTQKSTFRYHLIQKDAETHEIIGGETIVINKNPRTLFDADAGEDLLINANETITLNAKDIQEPAIYNWYDSNGNLIHQGQNLQIPNAIAENYRLEVISNLDGFKDYAEVEIKLKPSSIESISPNPASNNILVNYKLNGADSAYLMIIGYNNGTSNNYILNLNSDHTSISINNYLAGYYTVAIIVNGKIVDTKTLIKQ